MLEYHLGDNFTPLPYPKKTGNESLSESWILHKLTAAAVGVNKAFGNWEFSNTTKITYDYWYNQLCDVFIEVAKGIFKDGTPTERESAKQTLYTALEGALRLIQPMMPFLSEELWQLLPRRPDDNTPACCVASYPDDSSLEDPETDRIYELILDISRAIRALSANFDIKDNATIFISPLDATTRSLCEEETRAIRSLGGKAIDKGTLSILSPSDGKPAGCIAQSIGTSAVVYLQVRDRVDVDALISTAKGKLQKANELVEKQRTLINKDGFGKMPEDKQKSEKEKMDERRAEVQVLEESLGQFERLKLE